MLTLNAPFPQLLQGRHGSERRDLDVIHHAILSCCAGMEPPPSKSAIERVNIRAAVLRWPKVDADRD